MIHNRLLRHFLEIAADTAGYDQVDTFYDEEDARHNSEVCGKESRIDKETDTRNDDNDRNDQRQGEESAADRVLAFGADRVDHTDDTANDQPSRSDEQDDRFHHKSRVIIENNKASCEQGEDRDDEIQQTTIRDAHDQEYDSGTEQEDHTYVQKTERSRHGSRETSDTAEDHQNTKDNH